MPPNPTSNAADLKLAFATASKGEHAGAISDALEALIAVTGHESAARFAFEHYLQSYSLPAQAADRVLMIWAPDEAFPAFLREHPDPTVVAAVRSRRELERKLEASLERAKGHFRVVSKPRPWPDD